MACQQLFGTTELLEAVLLFLPLPDLLRVQAVNSRWQRTIRKSTPLQERLFLKDIKQESIWLARVTNLPSGMGPLPRRYPADVQVMVSVPINSEELQSHQGLVVRPVQINPLCVHRLVTSPDLDTAPEFVLDKNANNGTPIFLNKELDLLNRQPLDKGRESWQDMFLTQPSIQYLTVEVGALQELDTMGLMFRRSRLYRWRSPLTASKKVFSEGGVKIKDVVLAMQELKKGMTASPPTNEEAEPHALYMHGAISVNEADEKIIDGRTHRWRQGQPVDSTWSLI